MKITQSKLNNHLLTAAGILRNKTAGQDYKNYILSVLFYKCLCDQWDSEVEASIINLEIQQNKKFSEKEKNLTKHLKDKDEVIKELENKLNEEENLNKNLKDQDEKIKELQDEIDNLKIKSSKSATTDSNSNDIAEKT